MFCTEASTLYRGAVRGVFSNEFRPQVEIYGFAPENCGFPGWKSKMSRLEIQDFHLVGFQPEVKNPLIILPLDWFNLRTVAIYSTREARQFKPTCNFNLS